MPSAESIVIRVVADVSRQLAPHLASQLQAPTLRFLSRDFEELLAQLGTDAAKLLTYLDSLDFAIVVTQLRINNDLGEVAKEQLREGLRLVGIADGQLLDNAVDMLHRAVRSACAGVRRQIGPQETRINQDDLFAAGAENSGMLKRLRSLTECHNFAAHMRSQVVKLHHSIRLPHVGVSRAVPYDQLYVQPTVDPPQHHLGGVGSRTVVLGDPGAGKSTLAAKFAHDIAIDPSGQVPFLVVLREFTGAFAEGGKDLVLYLEMLSRAPYNVPPPVDGVEYLLRTGRAVIILDGLDELVRTELRRRFVALVEGFAHRYPLVPILVTARKIGYRDAPLSGELFTVRSIQEFDRYQVQDYVQRWFANNEGIWPGDRDRLAALFIEDSERIPELRSNPLLLTLLCAMYSSDRYLPRNLAQVYERCALMLFEQWDSIRGISLPLSFQGRLRGAVQHLAWKMFTAPTSGKAQSRTRITRMLTDYLEAKLDDYDESIETAERFLLFCTGRAWILTDVGATETEPQYGFTHRTFLEYFAAEHLVRNHRTSPELWKTMRPNINQWDVVAQVALQLYDRNVEGGVDELLTEAVDDGGLDFAARSLHYVTPVKRTVRAIAIAATDAAALLPIDKRLTAFEFIDDNPVINCLFESSAVNRPAVEEAVAERLGELVERGEIGAALMLETLRPPNRNHTRWPEIKNDLMSAHHATLINLWKKSPCAVGAFPRMEPTVLHGMIQHSGALPLYLSFRGSNFLYRSLAQEVLTNSDSTIPEAGLIASEMINLPTPWFGREDFQHHRLADLSQLTDPLRMILSLPFLESNQQRKSNRRMPADWLSHENLPAEAHDFLTRWARGEISLLAPDQQPPRRLPAPR